MMELLHSPYPEDARAGICWASIEMLRDLYREKKDDPQVQQIQASLDHAIEAWNDGQVEDFWVNHLLEPPHSDEFREKSPQERRAALRQLSSYLFDQAMIE